MSPQQLPDQPPYRITQTGQQLSAAPHHRPPSIEYRDGVPYHYTVGQPPAPQHITVQLPEQRGLSPELQRLIIITFLVLAVVVVCTGALCAIVVLMGGTLMGIISTVGDNAMMISIIVVSAIVAAGWTMSKIKAATESAAARCRAKD